MVGKKEVGFKEWRIESSFKRVAMSPLEGRVSWPWARE